ncbi:MAG: hypothetical protein ACREQV_17215, partial [Candidatus Binatia bacterium]
MEIKIKDAGVQTIKTDLLVLPVVEKQLEEAPLRALDRQLKSQLRQRIEKSNFTGADGTSLLYST